MSRGNLDCVSPETKNLWAKNVPTQLDVDVLRFLPYFDMSCNDRRIVTRRISNKEHNILNMWAVYQFVHFDNETKVLFYKDKDFHDLVGTTLYEAYSGPQEGKK